MALRNLFFASIPVLMIGCSREAPETPSPAQATSVTAPATNIYADKVRLNYDVAALGKANEYIAKTAPPGRQFWFFLDPAHDLMANHGYLTLDSTMEMLKARNTKHLFIERPMMFQSIVDKFAAGEISEPVFKAAAEHMAANGWLILKQEKNLDLDILVQTVRQCEANGIKLHFTDLQPETFRTDDLHALRKAGDEMVEAWIAYLEQNPSYFAIENEYERNSKYGTVIGPIMSRHKELTNPQPAAGRNKTGNPMMDIVIPERMAADKKVADLMREKAGQDNAAGQFGYYHFTLEQGGIDYYLGGSDATFMIASWGNLQHRERELSGENAEFRKKIGLGNQSADMHLFFRPVVVDMPGRDPMIFSAEENNGVAVAVPDIG